MPYRHLIFQNERFYHVFNRGVNKQSIFTNGNDYARFLDILLYYQIQGPKPSFSTQKRFKLIDYMHNPKLIDVVSYCFMPNHFHLLLKQNIDNGVHEIMRKTLNSYTKYYNTRHNRVGHLFQGEFKAVSVENEEQLLHLSRYIHLNPYVDGLIKYLEAFSFSSYPEFIGTRSRQTCTPDAILSFFKSPQAYKAFVADHQDYAKTLAQIKHATFE